MSDQQKIWFVYLTDHHEGPFTPAEVAEKLQQGLVTAQSLGWKDGMPEWVAIGSIPELASVLGGGAAPAPAAAAGGEEGFSLAQLLASQQQGGTQGGAVPTQEDPSLTGATSVLSQMVGSVHSANPVGTGSVSIDISGKTGAGQPQESAADVQPDPTAEVWTMNVGDQVSGLYSYNRLIELATMGEVPADARFWRAGWADFQTLAKLPEVAASRRHRAMSSSSNAAPNSLKSGGASTRPAGFAPITAGANVGNDDPTDPSINTAGMKEKVGFFAKIAGIFKRKKKAEPTKSIGVAKKVQTKNASGGGGRLKKILVPVLALVVLAGGGGAAYFFLFSSPIPSGLDVAPDDFVAMKAVVKQPIAGGGHFYLGIAKGTEDDPVDLTAPKIYVATNLAEGTQVSLLLVGQVGTLVNRVSFEKTFSATVGKDHLAVFDQVKDDGKPIPMGEYDIKVSAAGAETLSSSRFLGGAKAGPYQDRLKKYKDKLQAEFDKEMAEFREFIETLKSLQADVSKKIADYKSGWAVPANHAKIVSEWKASATTASQMLSQLDQKIKAKQGATGIQIYNPRTLQDVATLVSQMGQLIQAHGQRLESAAPSTVNVDELEGLTKAAVTTLDQWLTQTLVKSPLEALSGAGANVSSPAAAPVSAAPTAAPPPAAPAPAAPAPATK